MNRYEILLDKGTIFGSLSSSESEVFGQILYMSDERGRFYTYEDSRKEICNRLKKYRKKEIGDIWLRNIIKNLVEKKAIIKVGRGVYKINDKYINIF